MKTMENMKESAGKPKVLMLAFGHPDNVLSLCRAISRDVDVELVFIISGDRFRQGIIDIDISKMPYGLSSYDESGCLLPDEIKNFIDSSFKVRLIRTPSRKLLRDSRLKNLRVVYKAALVLKKEGYQVVHYNGASGFVAYFRLLMGRNIKSIWTIHDYIPHSGEANPRGYFLQRMTMRMGFEYIQHYSWLRDRFIDHYKVDPEKVHHVYSGSFDIFKQFNPVKVTEFKDYILFFGRISPYKGIDSLINVFLRFKSKYPKLNIRLCIAGSGDLWFDDSMLNHPDIFFINRYIRTEELVCLIKNCRFVVLPYTDSTHSAVVMTSYAFHKPVVGTDVGGLGEVILNNKTGYLVSRNNLNEMADIMFKLSSDDGLVQKFENNIKQLNSNGHINWDAVSIKMKKIYQSNS